MKSCPELSNDLAFFYMPKKVMALRLLLLLAGAITIALFYGAPNLLSRTAAAFPAILGADEPFYMLRMSAAFRGDRVMSCAQDPALKTEQTFIPNAMELLWASALKPLTGGNVGLAFKATYFFLPGILYVWLAALLDLLTGSLPLSLLVAGLGMLEPGVLYWKPFVAPEKWYVLPFQRYANPLLFEIPLVLSLFLAIFAVRKEFSSGKNARFLLWLAAMIGALCATFNSQVFYWSWFLGTICVFTCLSILQKDRQSARVSMYILLICVPLAAFQLYKNLTLASQPLVSDVMHRVGYLIANRVPFYLFHKGLLGTFVIYQWVCWEKWDRNWRMLTAGMLAGYFLLNQNVLTGLSNQDHHYFRPMSILYILVVGDFVTRILKRPFIEGLARAKPASALLLALLVSGSAAIRLQKFARETERPGAHGFNAARLERTIQALRDLPEAKNSSILMDPEVSSVVGVLGGVPIFVQEYSHHCMISNDELFVRWGFLHRAIGRSNQEYASWMSGKSPATLPWWLYGLPESYSGPTNKNLPEDRRAMLEASVESYAARSMESFAQELRKKHGLPKYALSEPGFRLDLEALGRIFDAELVVDVPTEKAQIWKLELRP